MWTPKQLLNPAVVTALRAAGLHPLQIEFLGWKNGNATTLNRAHEQGGDLKCVTAAHTCLASEGNAKMYEAFLAKKRDSLKPRFAEHAAVNKMTEDFLVEMKNLDVDMGY